MKRRYEYRVRYNGVVFVSVWPRWVHYCIAFGVLGGLVVVGWVCGR